ncbi:MAG: MFS transporter [Thermaerobacter sp.]|nr:MFS transporter [Thermaerobacter sp.]
MQSWLSRYPKPLLVLVASTVLMVSGFSLLWPLVTIYVHTRLGLSMTDAGLVLLLQSAANLAGNFIGGNLFDVWGGRRTIVTGALLAAIATTAMAIFQGILPYALLTVAVGVGTGLVYPSIYSYAATVWPEGRRAAFNAVYVASNVGVAVGSFAGGFLAQVSFSLSFATTGAIFLIYLICVLLAFRGPAWEKAARPTAPATAGSTLRTPLFALAPLLLAGGMFLDWAAYVQWQVTVPTHMQALGFPLSSYSLLWTLNGAVILLGQPLVTWLTGRVPRVKAQILIGNALFVAAFLVLVRTAIYPGFLIAMALATFGEMLVWPGVPAAADQLAPEGRRGLYQGLISGASSAGRGLGPLLGGLLYDHFPSPMLFAAMTGIFILGFFVLALHDRTAIRQASAPSVPLDH